MRAFYLSFSIWHAVRAEITWTDYKLLMRIENEQAISGLFKDTSPNTDFTKSANKLESILTEFSRTLQHISEYVQKLTRRIEPKEIVKPIMRTTPPQPKQEKEQYRGI